MAQATQTIRRNPECDLGRTFIAVSSLFGDLIDAPGAFFEESLRCRVIDRLARTCQEVKYTPVQRSRPNPSQ